MQNILRSHDTNDILFATAGIGITVIRLLIAISIGSMIFLGINDYKLLAIVGTSLIMFADYFDGFLFNKSVIADKKEWRIRRRLADSIVDRLVIQSVCLPILFVQPTFVFVYLCILSRELLLSGYSSYLFRSGILIYPGWIAKVACSLVGITGISYLMFDGVITWILTFMMMVSSYFAFLEYKSKMSLFLQSIPNLNRLEGDSPIEIM